MSLRPTTSSLFDLVRAGIARNQLRLARAQEQVASGKRILRPSDDPLGAATAISLRSRQSAIGARLGAIGSARPVLESSTSILQNTSDLVSQARSLVVQAMNGTQDELTRRSIADQIAMLREELLSAANTRQGDRYLFAGSASSSEPFRETTVHGEQRVVYVGNDVEQGVPIGNGDEVRINVSGAQAFGSEAPSGPRFAGLTGAAAGTSASSGAGYGTLHVRHETTSGALGSGLAFVAGGAGDTIMGDHSLVVDATANTVRLGDGPTRTIPPVGDPGRADVRVVDADGSELHLDFGAWDGSDTSTTVRGDGSLSLDGTTWTATTLGEGDLQLVDSELGVVLHVDTTGIGRSGDELVTFGGTTNLFDTLWGIEQDLRNEEGLRTSEVIDRVGERLTELDGAYDQVLGSLGRLGARTERLRAAETRLQEVEVHLEGRLSDVEDVDLTEALIEMARTESSLEAAQATGARLLQHSLLNYLA